MSYHKALLKENNGKCHRHMYWLAKPITIMLSFVKRNAEKCGLMHIVFQQKCPPCLLLSGNLTVYYYLLMNPGCDSLDFEN